MSGILLDILAGTAVAVLSGMGVGSGGLLVVYLTLAAGMQQAPAQALNLFFFLFAAGAEQTVYKACRDPREREQKRAFARCRRYEKARRQRAAVRGLFF